MEMTDKEYIAICEELNYIHCRVGDIEACIVVNNTPAFQWTPEEIYREVLSQAKSASLHIQKIYEMLPKKEIK